MIKAIVFDIGGVLIGLDLGRCISAFREDLGFDQITALLDPCHQKGIYGDMEEGKVTADQFRAYVLAGSRPGARPEDVDKAMGQLLAGVDPHTAEAVRRLRERYPLFLLSNNNPISMPFCLRALEQAGLDPEITFREQFISCEMKLLKPSPEIYQEAVRRIGLPAGEILFIDDNRENVEGARAVGLQARLFVPGTDDMREFLSDL
ncbi:MAG: HAD family phosphatase [Bacteroidales bacterium]|nr:HAD family phosphatase [Bacteroidales bacterium]